jgi:hypothetical protein
MRDASDAVESRQATDGLQASIWLIVVSATQSTLAAVGNR